jgi:hypothetical protein
MIIRLRANGTGVAVTWPPDTRRSIWAGSADANTSAGAPLWIWVASVEDDPKLNVTATLGQRRRGRHGHRGAAGLAGDGRARGSRRRGRAGDDDDRDEATDAQAHDGLPPGRPP